MLVFKDTVKKTLRIYLHLLDNAAFRSPNIDFFTANHLWSLQNDLLSRIKLCHIDFLGVTSRVRSYFFMNMLGKQEILVDWRLHLTSNLIRGIGEQFYNLDCVLGGNYIAHFRSAQASLVGLAQLPEPIGHLLIEVKRLPVVSTKKWKSNFVLALCVWSAHHWLELALLVLNHLFAPLGLCDSGIRQCL